MSRLIVTLALSLWCLNGDAKDQHQWLAELSAIAAAVDADVTTPSPSPPVRVPRAKCPVCKGTGKIKSGDGLAWVACDNCFDDTTASTTTTTTMTRQVRVDYCDGRRCWPSYHTETKQVRAAEVAAHVSQGWRVQSTK